MLDQISSMRRSQEGLNPDIPRLWTIMRLRQMKKLSSIGLTCTVCFFLFIVYPRTNQTSYVEISSEDSGSQPHWQEEIKSKPSDTALDETNQCKERKNVLLLIADDLRPQLSSYYGADFPQPYTNIPIHTPNLDKLASRSLLLKRAYAQWSSCGPSRASFLTGRRPQTTKVWDLHTSWRDSGGNFTSLPQLFRESGYTTVGAGKVFHPVDSTNGADALSWTLPFYDPPNLPHWSRVSTVGVSWKAVTKEERQATPLEDEQTTEHVLKLLQNLAPDARNCTKPFFLAAGFHKPHLPFVFPEEFLKYYPLPDVTPASNPDAPLNMPEIAWDDFIELRRYLDIKKLHHKGHINETFPTIVSRQLRRAYYASVSYVDYLVGEILNELKKQGLEDSTVVAFMGDHGFSLGENGEWAKHNNFEQTLHVPLMLRVPGQTDHGAMSRSLVELIDIYPTIVEAAGLGTLPGCPEISTNVTVCTEGVSLMPLVHNPQVELRDAAYSQHKRNNLRMGYSLRTDQFRYTEWIQISRTWSSYERWDFHNNWGRLLGVELYDHSIDPLENNNRAEDPAYSDIILQLSTKLHTVFGAEILDFPRHSGTLFLDY